MGFSLIGKCAFREKVSNDGIPTVRGHAQGAISSWLLHVGPLAPGSLHVGPTGVILGARV